MNTIKAGQILKARSICDHNCIFSLEVISIKKNFALIKYHGKTRKTLIRKNSESEYLRPDSYSFAPVFYPNK